jgi:hypothetical protein
MTLEHGFLAELSLDAWTHPADTECMTISQLATDTTAWSRFRDGVRTRLLDALPSQDACLDRAALRARARTERGRRRAVARLLASYPASRSAAAFVVPAGAGSNG